VVAQTVPAPEVVVVVLEHHGLLVVITQVMGVHIEFRIMTAAEHAVQAVAVGIAITVVINLSGARVEQIVLTDVR
jgi:hypothetical protein